MVIIQERGKYTVIIPLDSKTGIAPWIMLFFLLILLVAGTILRGLIHYRHPFANKGFLIFSGILIAIAVISYLFKVMKWKS